MKHIHLLVSQGSNVAVDAVLGRVQFPRPLEYDPRLHGSDGGFDDEELTEYFPQTPPKRITFTISTGGRIFVMSNSSGGTAGGILSHDLVHVDFDIRSWTEGFSWEIPDSVKGVIAWIRGVEHWTVWKSQGKLRIKVPQDLEAQQELRETWAPYNRQLFPRGERGEGWARMVFPPEIHRRWDEVVLEGFGGELEPWLGFAWRGEHVMTKYLTMVLTREQFFGRFPEMRRGEVEENHEDSDGGHEKGVQILPLEQHRYRHLPDHPMSALPPPLIDVEERPLKMYVGKEQPRLARFFGEFNLMANRSIPIYYVCGEP
ncbi:hypothetical protein DFH27DRAFT_577797 [Peziza echinospora]|nr:hypothetical protein DFH27DRAFT_577797 [Peziza echinospora]